VSAGQPAAVAFCPHPPLLVSEVGAGEPVAVRVPAIAAVRRLAALPIARIVVLGAGEAAATYGPGAPGSFAGYGLDREVSLPGGPAAGPLCSSLPLALAVGAWLLEQVSWTGAAMGLACDPEGTHPPVTLDGGDALLVMGDASARRTEKAPGWLDERAAGFDTQVSAALAAGDPELLGRLDPALGHDLLAAGVPAWRATSRLVAGSSWDGAVSYDEAPYGVGYLVATWSTPQRRA
jgi:hypothetical protein